MLKEIFDEKRHKLGVLVFVDLGCGWVLPLKARLLLGIGVGVVFDRFEHSGAQLGSEAAEGALLL
jgi:hypothetical protein